MSFSIKAKKPEERELERKSALPIESSDSETEEEKERTNQPPRGAIMMKRTFQENVSADFKERRGFLPDERMSTDAQDWRELYPDEDAPPADYGEKPFPTPLPDSNPRKPPIPPEELAFRNCEY